MNMTKREILSGVFSHVSAVRSESQPEARRFVMHGGKLRSGSSTRRSAADGQTTGLDKREVVSHVRTRSLDRSSPRVRRTDNLGLPTDDRSDVENPDHYFPRKSRKKVPMKLPESPLYSPETLDALDKAEKLIREAQKRILEASYDVNSSSEREFSDGSPRIDKMGKDDEALYIRDIVASRFHEANESGRIYTRVSARRPIERLRRPEVRQTPYRPIVRERGVVCRAGSTIPRRLQVKHEDAQIPASFVTEKSKNASLPKRKDPEKPETPKTFGRSSEKCHDIENRDDRTTGKVFRVQQGPHLDIRNELTTTKLEKIDISPCSTALPPPSNSKTYEFRHVTCLEEIAEKDNGPGAHEPSTGHALETNVKSTGLTGKSSVVGPLSAYRRGSTCDLDESKSGRSIEGHEGRESTRIRRDVRNPSEKLDDRKESFMDFLQRAAQKENRLLPGERCRRNDSSEIRESKTTADAFDRAVEDFFRDYRRGNSAGHGCPEEMNSVDGKLFVDRGALEKSDNTGEYELSEDCEGLDDNWDLEDVNLEPLDLGELDSVLRKFDGTVDEVVRGARHLGALMAEYSINEAISDRSKSTSANANSPLIDRDKFFDTSSNPDGKAIDSDPTEKNSTIHGHLNISKTTNPKELAVSAGFSNGTSPLSRRADGTKKALKNVTSHPRFSTPLNNDLNIGKSFGNNVNCTSNEFAHFYNGIYRNDRGQKTSSSRDWLKTEKPNRDEPTRLVERAAVVPVGAKNDLRFEKKAILGEIEKKCNFQALFNRNGSARDDIDEIHETVTFPFSTPRDERNSVARSLTQDSPIARDDRENPLSETKLLECSRKKDSGKSELATAKRDVESPRSQSSRRKIDEFARTEVSSGKMKVRELKSVKSEKLGSVQVGDNAKAETIVFANEEQPKSHFANAYEPKDNSAKEREAGSKHVVSGSSASSLKDRTSFDVSTAYSEDFEETTASDDEAKGEKNSTKEPQLKSTPEQLDVPSKDDAKTYKSEEAKDTSPLSVALSGKSKAEIDYLEKSVSFSVIESNERNKGGKVSDGRCKSKNQANEDKPMNSKKPEEEVTEQSDIEETRNEARDVDREISNTTEKQSFDKKYSTSLDSRENGKTLELGVKFQGEKNDSIEPETELPKNSTIQNSEKSCQSRGSKLDEIVNFESVSLIHSTPKKIMKDSTCAGEKLHYTNPEAISSDASRAIDTCAENYSEGELYLPSSCSYSLGEIRISEPGTCRTTSRPADLESLLKNAEELNTFIGKDRPTNIDASDNTINPLDSGAVSPGEVQETDVESNSSSSGTRAIQSARDNALVKSH